MTHAEFLFPEDLPGPLGTVTASGGASVDDRTRREEESLESRGIKTNEKTTTNNLSSKSKAWLSGPGFLEGMFMLAHF